MSIMKKRVVALIFLLCGLVALIAYIASLSIGLTAANSVGIIGGADAPTVLFLLRESPAVLAVIGIAFVSLGVFFFCKKK